ncbi:hypothetical protein SCUCBS95973_003597 [Sporothrix curviconia]|uniref:Ubiquitination network signaling protein n=1 Tax=Sporothrix curviconia TaxID=1260050 RepID=A0ABP0BGL9_9PEZI
MPRASPSAKRQPGAANQRDTRNENGPGSHGKRTNRIQHKCPPGLPASGGDAIARPPSSAGNSVSPTSSSPAAVAGGAPSPPPLLAAAAAAAAVANGCSRETDSMASSSSSPVPSYHAQQRHRNSDAAMPTAASSRRPHAADRHQLTVDNVSLASSTDSLAVTQSAAAAAGAATASSSLAVSFDDSYRRIDVNAAKNANVHRDTGPFDLAMTILRSCPLYDTIAILIILMQLSPVVLSIVYMLFTVLTFVPPVTSSSGLSLTEMFEGGLGTPAFTTIMCMDVGVLLVWLFLWGPLQLLILDFAQIVIALTLGGGYNVSGASQGSANNVFVCLGIVIFSHFSHATSLEKLPHLGPLFAADHSSVFADQHMSLQQSSRFFSRRVGGASWVRNIFAIHILMQGVVRYIREWYLRREKRDSLANSLADPEAGKATYATETPIDATFPGAIDSEGHSSAAGNAAGTESSSHSVGSNAIGSGGSTAMSTGLASGPTDPDTSSVPGAGSSVSNVPSTTGHISSKKKKKQSALVRVRQPLWAALASTKIVMIKEYELSQAASESAGAEATDVDNLGNAPFYAQAGQIWVCYVGHDEVCFSTSVFPDEDMDAKYPNSLSPPSSSFIDTSKPFYVRINNATWQPTRIIPVTDNGDEEVAGGLPTDTEGGRDPALGKGTRWTGDIYGLTPLSSYECEFVSTCTGEVLFSTSVRTAAAPSRNTAMAAAKSAPPSQLRPHESPATTIKASIATQEAKLNDEKARIKTLRKDNNRRVNSLKKEIDRLAASVQSAGGNDDKFKQKITQNTVQQKQAEQAIEGIEAELKDVSTVPEEVLSQYRNKKSEWDREKAQFDGVVASFKSFKSSVDGEIRSLEDEHATFQAKRNKIASRIAKADSEHAQIMDANARGLDEAERRRQERVNIENEITRSHQSYIERLTAVQNANEEKVHTIESLHETMRSFYSSFDSERPYENRYALGSAPAAQVANAVPTSAPGAWPTPQMPASTLYVPNNTLWVPAPNMQTSSPSPMASQVAPATPFMHIQQLHGNPVPPLLRMRGRSSSMLSDVSGFTQSSNADDDNMVPLGGPAGSSLQNASAFVPASALSAQASQAGTVRGPPALSLVHGRGSSGSGPGSASGSGSVSSVRSGSGSVGSARDPSSPV